MKERKKKKKEKLVSLNMLTSWRWPHFIVEVAIPPEFGGREGRDQVGDDMRSEHFVLIVKVVDQLQRHRNDALNPIREMRRLCVCV